MQQRNLGHMDYKQEWKVVMVLICAHDHFSIIFHIANIGKGTSFFYSDRSKAKQHLYFETLASGYCHSPSRLYPEQS